MSAAHFQRGLLLCEQGRYREAIGELQLQLGAAAEDALTHAVLAQCYAELDELHPATEHARRAVHLEPENPAGHRALASVLLQRNRFAEALAGAVEAVRLNPFDPGLFALLAQVQMQRRDWRAALEASNAGLALDAEHSICQNLRAIALVHVGDRDAAAQTTTDALARRPDDALTHANQGWTLLHRGQPRQAAEHFREALRLEPGLEWARAGIVEALKARNPIYRWLLTYLLWLSRMPARKQWMIVVGLYLGAQVVNGIVKDEPAIRPFLAPFLYAYIFFALSTWLADSLFNLLLRFDRFGRHCLSRDQVRGANLFAIWIGSTLVLSTCYLGRGFVIAATIALFFTAAYLPASVLFKTEPGWPRQTVVLLILVNLAAAIFAASPMMAPESWLTEGYVNFWARVFPNITWVFLASQFIALGLTSATVKK